MLVDNSCKTFFQNTEEEPEISSNTTTSKPLKSRGWGDGQKLVFPQKESTDRSFFGFQKKTAGQPTPP